MRFVEGEKFQDCRRNNNRVGILVRKRLRYTNVFRFGRSWILRHTIQRWAINSVSHLVLLTAHNWQNWKRVFLTCPCHENYRGEAAGLKSCKYTWKNTIYVTMWNLRQFRENLILETAFFLCLNKRKSAQSFSHAKAQQRSDILPQHEMHQVYQSMTRGRLYRFFNGVIITKSSIDT